MKLLASLAVRLTVTLVAVAAAAVVGWQLWVYYMEAPWTRDGKVRADVVQIAPDVSGLVSEVLVHDNELVKKGQVLFQIDPVRFQLALRNAEAVAVQKQAAAQQAIRDMNRLRALTSLETSTEEVQQGEATAAEASAEYDQAVAERDTAKLNLQRATVIASVNGRVTNFSMKPGDYVQAGGAVMALVDTDSFYVDGYFEETKLPQIKVGDRALVHLMGESQVIVGHVQGLAAGIADREASRAASLLADVNPTFAWVRLAQRIPVRIALDHVPDSIRLIAGRTASVETVPGTAPQR